jgi:hypothetical protein
MKKTVKFKDDIEAARSKRYRSAMADLRSQKLYHLRYRFNLEMVLLVF